NPVISNANININSESKLAAHIKIYNQFGIQLQHLQRSLILGSNNIPVQGLSALPAGTYIIVVEDDKLNRIGTTQFIKQ
ncbi:MAG TPA: T9SS type A sorting domain-containing protein, partial [Niastella sp.]